MTNEQLEHCLKETLNHNAATILAMKAHHLALVGLIAARFSNRDQSPMRLDVISDVLQQTAKARLSELLIGLEDKNPGLAAAAQAILDGNAPSTSQN